MKTDKQEEVVIAGFGGQGVLTAGSILAYAAMLEGKQVTWMPSYGVEKRGGTANSTVIISTEEIGSPVVAHPSSAIIMNRPSLDRFEPELKPNGLIVLNSSIVDSKPARRDIELLAIPATEIADKLGAPVIANMVALGAYLAKRAVVSLETIKKSLPKVLPRHRQALVGINEQALDAGASFVRNEATKCVIKK